jgi:cell division protein FtsW
LKITLKKSAGIKDDALVARLRGDGFQSVGGEERSKITPSDSSARVDGSTRKAVKFSVLSSVMLVSISAFMVVFGIVMIFSASSISLMESDLVPWRLAATQAGFGLIGALCAWILANLPLVVYEFICFPFLVAVDVLLVLVQFFGEERGGNRNWLSFGFFQIQPSEFAKLFLCIWLGVRLAKHHSEGNIRNSRRVFNSKLVLGLMITLGLVLWGQDLGTAMIFMVMLFGEFFIAGISGKLLALIFTVLGGLAAAFVMTSSNRRERILGNYTNCGGDTQGVCYQSVHGMYALATGGITGVGPGASREKWSYLPEAHNDFIFSIIGEELGLMGTVTILICFIVLCVAISMVIIHSDQSAAKIIAGGILSWIGGQALFNIGAVLRILPVIGVPLPLISYGGTSLISTLAAIGVVLSFTKHHHRFASNAKRAGGITTVVAV